MDSELALFTPQNSPDLQAAAAAFAELCQVVACLRDPQQGCPWDRKQTHASLKGYLVEEALETLEAIDTAGPTELCDELGDVLLQVVLHAQLAHDAGSFTIHDVTRNLARKLVRRHPHVFGDTAGSEPTQEELRANWDKIKAEEKGGKRDALKAARQAFPSTRQSAALGKIAHEIGFDWQSPEEVLPVLKAELAEVEAALASGDRASVVEEIGDVYFTLGQLCRHLGQKPEAVAVDGNLKFLRRFTAMLELKNERHPMAAPSLDEWEVLWREVKENERR